MTSVFPTPIAYTADGTAPTGFWGGGSIGGLIAHCKAHGFKSVAVQVGQVTRQQVAWLQEAGLFVIVWEVLGSNLPQILDDLKPDGVHCQIEGPGQYDAALAAFSAIRGRSNIARGIVTTYWGLFNPLSPQDGLKWKALANLGVEEAWVECYAGENPVAASLDRMLGQGEVYGIPKAALKPLCGTFRGELPITYSGLRDRAPDFGVYIAESLSEPAWTAWGGVKPNVTQVYYWQVWNNATSKLLHEERATTYSPTDDGLGRTFKWLEDNKATVRSANDIEIKRVLLPLH